MNSKSPEFRIIDQESWIDFPPLNARDVKSDIDGDAAFVLLGLSDAQIKAISEITLEYFQNGCWNQAVFSESSFFPSLDWISAPCWYFPFDYQPLFEFHPDFKGNPPKWRALVPNNWTFPHS